MLTHIHVRNLAIVDEIDVELTTGMTALTGETGAGKSILVDALGLVLGDRADSAVVRHGCERAEISAGFDISDNGRATAWLTQRDLDMEGECQLRRIISREGRSRGYINGQTAPMQSLRELGELLVDIHGQHEHQSLLRSAVQQELLDAFGGHQNCCPKHAPSITTARQPGRDWQLSSAMLQNAMHGLTCCATSSRNWRHWNWTAKQSGTSMPNMPARQTPGTSLRPASRHSTGWTPMKATPPIP